MPLPFIPAVIALIAAGGSGVGFGADGVVKMNMAKSKVAKAKRKHADEHAAYLDAEASIQKLAVDYGRLQLQTQTETLGAWLTWLELNERKVRTLERSYVDGVRVAVPDIKGLRFQVVEASGLLEGAVSAAVASVAAQQAALFGVRSLATAGTGAAISGLTGAAAESATLAWLGGGTLAAGGAGMAGGAAVLTGVAIAPALLIRGLTLSAQGEKALTQARAYEAKVNVACAQMQSRIELFRALRRRIREMRRLLADLRRGAEASLAELQAVDFDPAQHAEVFQRTALLMRALGEVLSTPLLDANGNQSEESITIIERYAG